MRFKVPEIPAIKNPIKRRAALLVFILLFFPVYLFFAWFGFWVDVGREFTRFLFRVWDNAKYEISDTAKRLKTAFGIGWRGYKD